MSQTVNSVHIAAYGCGDAAAGGVPLNCYIHYSMCVACTVPEHATVVNLADIDTFVCFV